MAFRPFLALSIVLVLFPLLIGCQKSAPNSKVDSTAQTNNEKKAKLAKIEELVLIDRGIEEMYYQVKSRLEQTDKVYPDLDQILAFGFRVKDHRRLFPLEQARHRLITDVFVGGPAYRAGLRQGDYIHHVEHVTDQDQQQAENWYNPITGDLVSSVVENLLVIIDRPGQCFVQFRLQSYQWTGQRKRQAYKMRGARLRLRMLESKIFVEKQLTTYDRDFLEDDHYLSLITDLRLEEARQAMDRVRVEHALFLNTHKQLQNMVQPF